ncbi:GNAT family N-acetyltransferase [Ensifer sp. ENS06]|uniref:GNAT family N-acetyltransferase n=1 Tax=Ensifer sp. ENS06 TaxID=2769276 RepID=UPI001FEEAA33|nr:N-acetyltransferase [Ensifer sp. ENS06]
MAQLAQFDLRIRVGRESDADLIHRGLKLIAAHLSLEDKVTATVEDIRRHGFGSRPAFATLIAEVSGQFAGLCLYFDSFSTWSGRPGAYIQDLVVDPQFRGLGVGETLMRAAIARIWAAGGRYVRLSVDASNTGAHRFYEKMGLEWCQEERIYALRGDAFASIASPS